MGEDYPMAIKKINSTARATKQREKSFNGKPVKPVRYVGGWLGHGNYIAVQEESGKLVKDNEGKPIPFGSI